MALRYDRVHVGFSRPYECEGKVDFAGDLVAVEARARERAHAVDGNHGETCRDAVAPSVANGSVDKREALVTHQLADDNLFVFCGGTLTIQVTGRHAPVGEVPGHFGGGVGFP